MHSTLAILVLCFAGIFAQQQYTTKYDNIDVEQILHNDRLLKPYLNCLLKPNAPCTPEARELKSLLPEALNTNCEKCSEKQKANAQKVIKFLAQNRPEVWEELIGKYDKDNVYRTKYAEQAKALGVPIP